VLILNVSDETKYLKKGSELTEAVAARSCSVELNASPKTEYSHIDLLVSEATDRLSSDERSKLSQLVQSYSDVFSTGEYDLGQTDLARHTIDTGSERPVKQALRRQPYSHLESIDKQVQDMLKAGIIEPSQSPWVANVVMVTKKDGNPRFCVDYRRLNDCTVKDFYPLPRIETCLDTLGGSKYFSTFDLRSGYHQLLMDPADADKTSFVTRTGRYQFRVLPFGLCNAGATFQRIMDIAMSGLNFTTCLVYLNDIIVYSRTIDDHLVRLEQIFVRLRMAKLKLKPSKCKLIRTSVEFLGHVVSDKGVSTDPAKIKAVADWPRPVNVSEVRSFLGLCSYYRRFILGFASIAAPLHKLTGKNVRFYWNNECESAMKKLCSSLVSAPILAMPIDEGGYVLDTDASQFAIGAILSQRQDGVEKVIAYASRVLNDAEKNYCVTRKELLAVVFYTKHFRHYLLGRPFQIRTDHAALQWLGKTPTPIGQQARWLDILGEFDYKVLHRPGRVHQNADALSRRPCRQCGVDSEVGIIEEDNVVLCAIHLGDVHADDQSPWSLSSMVAATVDDPELQVVTSWFGESVGKPPWNSVIGCSRVIKQFWKQFGSLKLENDVLYKEWFDRTGVREGWRLIVPLGLRDQFVKIAHGGSTGGHLSVEKSIDQVRKRAYWPDLVNDVNRIVRSCPQCVCYHRGSAPRNGPLQISPVGEPWERVSIDTTGPHPRSRNGKCYILTMVDHFSKWAEAWAIPNHEAATIAKVLIEQ